MPPGCFGYLPVELFRIGPKFFAFDAGSVLFMEVDRISQGDEAPFLKSCRVGHGFNAFCRAATLPCARRRPDM